MTTTSIGYALGIGSGLDIRTLVNDLASAAKAPREALITRREEANAAKLSALGEMSSAIDSFSKALSNLISGGTLHAQPSVSDGSILSASAIAGKRLGSLSAELEVVQLAKAQTIQSAAVASRSDPIGQGELTLTTSAGSFAITVDASNDSLDGLAQAINAQESGVKASVVVDTNGARLVLKGGSGAAEAFTLSAAEGTTSGLERFAYGPSVVGGMSLAQAAQNAIVRLDGVEVSRSTNSFSDLIEGVQIDLKKAMPGTIVSMGVTRPSAEITQGVNDFVAAYNEVMSMIAEATAFGVNGEGGPLRGDLGVREMQRQLRELPSKALVNQGTGPKTLAEIGVRTNRDGTLSVDAGKLEAVLASDPEGVEALFNPTQYSSHPDIVIKSAMGRVKPGVYTITDLVPASDGTPASGKIDGVAATGIGGNIVASSGSNAIGLILGVNAAVSSVTITVEAGLAGALKAVRDTLLGSGGPFASAKERLSDEADDIADDRIALETRSEKYYNQLLNTFTAMERQVSSFKATQSYLDQQIKMWTNDQG
ncbi:flagellar filament capping protein FliD [Sphingosinicella sp. CPCC 101087]|uniref:flagellar filament capping protein FliD n=1 Tax=Sphingosinicella sp. CPCC 101087 TaxID=2497754 RepID=UPI00101B7980|nr:flagellar filament capping protein FliD [Sphingosinicella sp. CPCC 101087]